MKNLNLCHFITFFSSWFFLIVTGCLPTVQMPGVLDPLNDPKWKACAEDLAARQEQAMLDNFMLDSDRLVCQGVVTATEGKVNESMNLFAKAAVKDPKDHRPHYLAGRILTDEGRYDEALTAFERSYERYPALAVPTERMGRNIEKTKGAEESAAFLRRAMDRNLCDYGCKGLLAQLYKNLEKTVFAKPLYEQMAAEEPWEPAAFVGLAALSNAEGDFQKEISYLEKATAAKNFKELSTSQQGSIYYSLAFAKFNREDYFGARRVIEDAVKLNPNRADWYLLAGWIDLKTNNASQALASFEKAKSIDQNQAVIHEGIGDAEMVLGNFSNARNAYSRARIIDPSNALYSLKLAHAAALDGDQNIAKQWYDNAVASAGAVGLPKELLEKVSALIENNK